MKEQTVTYMCKARASEHGQDGVLYRHGFGTGYQDLVFATHQTAEEFAKREGATYTGPK